MCVCMTEVENSETPSWMTATAAAIKYLSNVSLFYAYALKAIAERVRVHISHCIWKSFNAIDFIVRPYWLQLAFSAGVWWPIREFIWVHFDLTKQNFTVMYAANGRPFKRFQPWARNMKALWNQLKLIGKMTTQRKRHAARHFAAILNENLREISLFSMRFHVNAFHSHSFALSPVRSDRSLLCFPIFFDLCAAHSVRACAHSPFHMNWFNCRVSRFPFYFHVQKCTKSYFAVGICTPMNSLSLSLSIQFSPLSTSICKSSWIYVCV